MHTVEEALDILNEDSDASDSEREMQNQDIDVSSNNDAIPVQSLPKSDGSLSDEELITESVDQNEQSNNGVTWTPLLAARVQAPT